MEFVIVRFVQQPRRVFIDNQEQGVTGQRQRVEEGFHVFDLGSPADYTPPAIEVNVTGTTPDNPLPVVFAPLVVAPVPKTKKPAAKASAKKKAAPRKTKKAAARKGKARKPASKKR